MTKIIKLIITNNFKLQCFVIDEENNTQTNIKLNSTDTTNEYPICISFINNSIIIAEENQNSIQFIQDLINNPEDFKHYTINYQQKEYSLIAEILFALIINEFKEKIEKEHIIEGMIIELQSNNAILHQRIKTSLESIGVKNVEINPLHYDYSEDGEIFTELMNKKKEYDKYQNMMKKAEEFINNEEERNKLKESKKNISNEIEFYEKMVNTFNTKERSKLGLCQLDNYCIFITSRYFDSLEDHINLVKVSKRMRGNLEKFHYNPISLNNKTVTFFQNVETLHIYEENDIYLNCGRINQYVDWREIGYYKSKKLREENQGKEIDFKHIIWTYEDTDEEYDKQNPQKLKPFHNWSFRIDIPEGVKEINKYSFTYHGFEIKSITIPSSITKISKNYFVNCYELSSITIPLNDSLIVCENQILKINEKKLQKYLRFQHKIYEINGEENKGTTSFSIPTYVTSFDERCLSDWRELKELIIPDSIKWNEKNYPIHNGYFTNITLPMNDSQMIIGNKIFKKQSHLEQDVYSPHSIKIINGEEVDRSEMIIPTIITSLDENCFRECYKLRHLEIPSTVKSIPKNCFINCSKLTNITLSLNESQMIIGNKIFKNQSNLEQYIFLPENIQIINGIEVDILTSLEIPTTVTSLDENCFYNLYLEELTIPETVEDISINTFMKFPYSVKLTIKSNKYQISGNRLFYIDNECLCVIPLPLSIYCVNNQRVDPLETYTIPTNVTRLSDYCFANCEKLTEIKGLEHVKEIGKGCFINCPKLDREEYPEVEKNDEEYLNESVKEEHQKQLEEWTGLKCTDILFDSNVDDWSEKTSVFNERIIGKKQLSFLIEDDDNEIFGYYFNTEVKEIHDIQIGTDDKTFEFNLQSKNNRLPNPMKFEIMHTYDGGCVFRAEEDDMLIVLGEICLNKENTKNDSCCCDENNFNKQKIKKALCGKGYGERFTPKRIVVIQMK